MAEENERIYRMKYNLFKEIIVIYTVFLLFGMALMPAIISEIPKTENVKTFLEEKSEELIVYINASSPYDYGREVGKQFFLEYKMIDILTRFFKRDKNDKEYINNLSRFSPFFLEELKGLSASTDINLERLISLHVSICSIFRGECTTTLSTGKSTKNNETFLTQNLDSGSVGTTIFWRIVSYKSWIVKVATMKYKYAFWGIPIVYEIPFLNEKGLGFGGNAIALTENESRYIDEGMGKSTYTLERLSMMTCKNVSEVATLWKNTNRSSGTSRDWPHFWDNSVSIWCDREGNVLMIEQMHNHIMTVFGNSTEITGGSEDILWHANHHQWLEANQTGSVFPGENQKANCSYLRMVRAHELLETNYGNITLEICKNITRDHGGGTNEDGGDSCDICRHPDKNLSAITMFSWIIMPKELVVCWTHGSPCTSRFIKHDFSKRF